MGVIYVFRVSVMCLLLSLYTGAFNLPMRARTRHDAPNEIYNNTIILLYYYFR